MLTNISVTVAAGERAGLIGENGSGKSTLLKIAGGVLEADSGAVRIATEHSITPAVGLLTQTPLFAQSDTIDAVLSQATAPIRQVAVDLERSAAAMAQNPADPTWGERYAALLADAERLSVWDLDARVAQTLEGLGLARVDRRRPAGHLSGGQQARLNLACVLLRQPTVLLLDEPSNHLDDRAADYLVGVLATWPGPVVLASHDRAFLDAAVTTLVDLDPSPVPHALRAGREGAVGVSRYRGTFSDYREHQRQERARWEQQYRKEQEELARLRQGVRDNQQVGHANFRPRTESRAAQKFYADRNAAVVSRRVKDMRGRLEELTNTQVARPPKPLRFSGFMAGQQGRPDTVITLGEAAVSGRLAPVSVDVRGDDRLLITGPNGAGKSTLLKLLAGQLTPTSGSVQVIGQCRIGYLGQDTTLHGVDLPAETYYRQQVGEKTAAAVPLSTFGLLAGRHHHTPANRLSIGQQRRLVLATVLATHPDVLILDEPTNHLSLGLVTDLEEALPSFGGAVVIASHDRWLRRSWAGRQLHLAGADGQ